MKIISIHVTGAKQQRDTEEERNIYICMWIRAREHSLESTKQFFCCFVCLVCILTWKRDTTNSFSGSFCLFLFDREYVNACDAAMRILSVTMKMSLFKAWENIFFFASLKKIMIRIRNFENRMRFLIFFSAWGLWEKSVRLIIEIYKN